jgi:hypothetical protein
LHSLAQSDCEGQGEEFSSEFNRARWAAVDGFVLAKDKAKEERPICALSYCSFAHHHHRVNW